MPAIFDITADEFRQCSPAEPVDNGRNNVADLTLQDFSEGLGWLIVNSVAGPGSTLIDLDGTAMETIRALSPSWEVGVRFREWLINAVFSISPHLDHDLSVWATAAQWQAGDGAETGIQLSGCESAEVARAWRWSEELKTWPMTRLQ